MPHRPQFFGPLSLAAYLTWLAVATEPALQLWRAGLPMRLPPLAGFAALSAVLLLFILREASRSRRLQQALTLAQLPAALAAFAVFREGMLPILLILVAAQAAALFSTASLLWLMLLANAALLGLMLEAWPPLQALVSGVAYLGFQGFAALTVRAMSEAQAARDAAQRINAELLATRALLAEGARA